MSKHIPVPPELQHLIEKREQETDRRQQKPPSGSAPPADATETDAKPERRKRQRRRGRRKRGA